MNLEELELQMKTIRETFLREARNDPVVLAQGTVTDVVQQGPILEYVLGGARIGARYLQRMGSPGHYIYIYPSKGFEKMTRRARFAYGRMVNKAKKFLTKMQIHYGATSMNVKPKTWHLAVVKMTGKETGSTEFLFNLKSHQIYSYRSHRGVTGASAALSKSKKAGILRYR